MGNSTSFPTGPLGDAIVPRGSNPSSSFDKKLDYVYQLAIADRKAATSATIAASVTWLPRCYES